MLKKKIIIISLGIAAIGLTSCKKQLDINVDPSNPSLGQLTPKLVFPAAVGSSAGRIGGDLGILGGIWAQYYTQGTTSNQYKDVDAYNLTKGYGSTNSGVAWVELYSGALNDLNFVITKAAVSKDWNYYLIGTVMKAYTMQVLVDLYDQVPYTEAFKGADNLQPKFDDGYTVYKGLLAELDSALNKDFTASTNTSPGVTDFIFPLSESTWSITPWRKFANTLKLKLYLRMTYAKPTDADAGIKALYTSGAQFLDVDASMNVFEDAPDKRNPLYTYNFVEIGTDGNLRASRTFLTWLQNNTDPRIDNYFSTTSGSTTSYTGINQGDYSNPDVALNSASKPKVSPTDPVDFISVAESHFLQAEALERYYAGAGAKTQYDAAVTASFARYNDNAAPFLAIGGKYAYLSAGTFEQKLEQIIVQKWASMPNTHPLEAFFEKNRTTYPKTSTVYSDNATYIPGQFVYAKNGVTNGLFPKRLIFPDLETSKNANAPADQPVTKKIWWDVR
ncbi:MAG: SusD/RagB family nutrient-binding outer membrane lipoprotein [Chitinophagaceae bacterium]